MRPNKPEDIWSRIDRRSEGQCWPFTGSTFRCSGYGRFFLHRQAVLAHRVVYQLSYGPIADGLYVMHKCNNKRCCNPGHLKLGTNSENQRHASASGAFPLGTHGIRGVGFDRRRQYWTARGYRDGKMRNLYTGPHKEKAISARQKWEAENLITFKESGQ